MAGVITIIVYNAGVGGATAENRAGAGLKPGAKSVQKATSAIPGYPATYAVDGVQLAISCLIPRVSCKFVTPA